MQYLWEPVSVRCSPTVLAYFFTEQIDTLGLLLSEWRLDNDYSRFGLCATMPFIFCISLFFCLQLIGNLSYLYV